MPKKKEKEPKVQKSTDEEIFLHRELDFFKMNGTD